MTFVRLANPAHGTLVYTMQMTDEHTSIPSYLEEKHSVHATVLLETPLSVFPISSGGEIEFKSRFKK